MSRGSSSPESAPFPPPATNSQRSRRARAVTPPAEARGAGRLRRIRVEIEGEIRDEEKAAAAVAIGMRGAALFSKAAASARVCQREEWKWKGGAVGEKSRPKKQRFTREVKIVVAKRRTPSIRVAFVRP
jgi:hypothetical protein